MAARALLGSSAGALAASFADRKRQLGYRRITALSDTPLGATGSRFRGHEFHYSSQMKDGGAAPLFVATDAAGEDSASPARGPAASSAATCT